MNSGLYQATALAIYTLQTYGPPAEKVDTEKVIARAAGWLEAAQMAPSHPVYAKGVRYLLNTQAADGSWHVKMRSIWVQPYFESGFPYGTDQWISAAGTSWAAMALSVTVPSPDSASHETQIVSNRNGRE